MDFMLTMLLAVLYWTAMVAILAIVVAGNARVGWKEVGVAVVWPLLIPIMMVALPYMALVRSVEQIRVDLDNRKLLREFDEWVRANKKQ